MIWPVAELAIIALETVRLIAAVMFWTALAVLLVIMLTILIHPGRR